MAEHKNEQSSALSNAASAAGMARAAAKTGKALSGVAKGASAGPYGMLAAGLWEGRHLIAKVAAVLCALLLLPVAYIMMLPSLIFGNGGLDAASAEVLTDNGVIILKDAYAELSDEVLLLGREDLTEKEGRADVSSLPNPDPEKFLIVADHQPVDFKNNLKSGCDLQLSGHTHAGQLFPLGLFYNVISYNYGDYREGGAVMNVSAGACGWRVPLRTEAHCHYEVVRLVPENGNK